MASVLKLKTDIKKIKAAIASKATSGAIKTKLRGKLTSLENELDKLQPNKRKPKTTGPKNEAALVKLAKKRRTNQRLSTSKSDIERDAIRPAKKAGKRISASGNTYYEYRDNRVDNRQPPKQYRKLADGGGTSDGWYEDFNDSFEKLLTKKYITQEEYEKYVEILNQVDPLDKYGKMSGRSAAKKFVDDNKRYIKMADGGKTQGYDDKKDESLGMTRGKLSLKDFVGNRKQKEHSRRDDARFEERGMMADGGQTKKEYLFNFVGGGWNSIIAKNKAEAIKLAKAEYNSSKSTKVDENSFRIKTEKDYKQLMSSFYAKGGKTKEQEVVRGYFEDEAYEYGSGGQVMYLTSTGNSQRLVTDKSGATPMFIMDAEYYIKSNPKNSATMVAEKIDKTLPDGVGKNYIVKITKEHKMADGGELAKQKAEIERTTLRGIGQDYMKRLTAYRNLFEVNSQTYKLINDRIYDLNSIEIDLLTHADKDLRTDLADGGMMGHGGYMADGGSVAKGNYEMLMSQAKEIMHHAEELMQVAKPNMDVEAWVVSKAERATTDLSDITHYLDGLKMAMGGMVKHNTHKVNG
jgi:hypothetical protein